MSQCQWNASTQHPKCFGTVQSVSKAIAGIKTCMIRVVFDSCSVLIPAMFEVLKMLLVEFCVENLYQRPAW